jgi:DNA-binding CsgD family transcriptional regulator
MLFGGINGFNWFQPDSIVDNPYPPKVAIVDFQLFNQSVPVGELGEGRIILHQPISETRDMTLSYRDRVFTFEYSALHFVAPHKNKYAFKMEGFEDKWNFVGKRRFATYTNLHPGHYRFVVKAANNDGVWNEQGIFINLTITPPFWSTWWFRISMVLLLVALILFWHKSRMKRLSLRLKTETAMLKFFTKYNISDREQEVLKLMLEGKSNKEIEDILYVSPHTVKNHIYNIYKKLNVKNRTQIVLLFKDTVLVR